jgi:hypothetical protein
VETAEVPIARNEIDTKMMELHEVLLETTTHPNVHHGEEIDLPVDTAADLQWDTALEETRVATEGTAEFPQVPMLGAVVLVRDLPVAVDTALEAPLADTRIVMAEWVDTMITGNVMEDEAVVTEDEAVVMEDEAVGCLLEAPPALLPVVVVVLGRGAPMVATVIEGAALRSIEVDVMIVDIAPRVAFPPGLGNLIRWRTYTLFVATLGSFQSLLTSSCLSYTIHHSAL